jgi:hypothetical protein
MIGLFCFVLTVLASPFKSKLRLEAENAVSFGPGRSCVGTEPAFAATGVGSRVDGEGGHKSKRSCAC